MKLSSTESNLIVSREATWWSAVSILTAWQGVAGNLGMYAMGIPMGLLTDARGARVSALVGSICLALGYYPLYLCTFDSVARREDHSNLLQLTKAERARSPSFSCAFSLS